MNFQLKKPDMVQEAAKTGGKNIILEILMFVGVFFVAVLLENVLFLGVEVVVMYTDPLAVQIMQSGNLDALMEWEMNFMNSDPMLVFQLFATLVMTGIVMLFCKVLQKRKMRTLGFKEPGMWKEYGIGLLVGFAMMTVIVLIGVLTGAMTLEFNPQALTGSGIGLLVLLFVGFVLQGASEEIMCRGYFLVSLARKNGNIWMAVVMNAVAFGALHLGNPGLTALSMLNLVLFGIFASIYFVKRGNIWGIAAVHSIWNFAQGNIYGVLVSGIDFGATVFTMTLNDEMTLINGGSFGLEGGILTTIILIVASVIMLITKQKDVAVEEA